MEKHEKYLPVQIFIFHEGDRITYLSCLYSVFEYDVF